MRAVDVEALAGSWDLGTVREGFEIVRRVALPGGFGDEVIEENRRLLGDFPVEDGPQDSWTAEKDVAFIFGTPPCSGWSVMNTSKGMNARGSESAIQQCTWDLIRYAARCTGTDGRPGPEFISFECVQQPFTQGRALLSAYRDLLVEATGRDYAVTHVLMSGSSVGAAQYRPRYFFVAHAIPFGVGVESPRQQMTYRDAIYDLRGLRLTRDRQRIRRRATSDFQRALRVPDDVVDWHDQVADPTRENETNLELILRVMEYTDWRPGEYLKQVIERSNGKLPESLHKFGRGWGGPIRVEWDKPGRVIHGGGGGSFIHPDEDRFLTLRELARLMGYPDGWRFPEVKNRWSVSMWLGKNCPVQSGQWLSHWVAESLAGRPGPIRGRNDGDGEYVVNVTHAFKDPSRIVGEPVGAFE